jgi:hypothetical protein
MGEIKIFCAGPEKQLNMPKTDNVLITPDYFVSKSKIRYTVEMLKMCGAKYVLLDSGGFTILMYEEKGKMVTFDPTKPFIKEDNLLNLSPVHVAICASIVKPTFMVGLDYPVIKTDDPLEQYMDYTKKLGYNLHWTWASAEAREKYCPDIEFFVPIQAYNLDQLQFFWKHIHGIKFDGISLPIRNMSIEKLALFMMFFYQQGIDKVHILGTTKPMIIAMAAFMAKHWFPWISLDATTWQKMAKTGGYINHLDLSSEYIGNVIFENHYNNDCPCPFCKNKSFSDIYNLKGPAMTYFLGRHNFWVTEYFAKEAFNHCDDIHMLKYFLKKNFKPRRHKEIERLCNALTIVKNCKDDDLKVVEKLLMVP